MSWFEQMMDMNAASGADEEYREHFGTPAEVFYSISFNYPGPYCGISPDGPSSRALGRAEAAVERALDASGIEHRHQYSWPDGSLYWWVRSHLGGDAVKALIEHCLTDGVTIASVHPNDPDTDPHKVGCKTLREYFERPTR